MSGHFSTFQQFYEVFNKTFTFSNVLFAFRSSSLVASLLCLSCASFLDNSTFKSNKDEVADISFNFINLLKLEKQSKSYTQSAFTCSKLTIKTLDHGVKYVQVTKIY